MSDFAVTVFLSSTKVDRVFFDAASQLGGAIAEQGWTLVYGGNNVGPMGALAAGARTKGGRVVGISPRLFGDAMDPSCDEFVVAEDMRHRKAELERRASAFVILPGGIGTLEEFFEILVGRFLGLHGKPIVLVNIAGFYDPLLEMMRRGIETGFVRPSAWELVEVVTDVPEAMTRLAEIEHEEAGNLAKDGLAGR